MLEFVEPGLFWGLLVVQAVGLASIFLARLQPVCRYCSAGCRMIFLTSLVGVGLATMYAIGCNTGWWMFPATTLSLMAVGATSDHGAPASAF